MAGNATLNTNDALAHNGSVMVATREWASLFAKVPTARPFLSDAWVQQWLAVHEDSLRPYAFLYETPQSGVTAAALLVPRVHHRGPVPYRQLFLNTDGELSQDSVVVENNMLLCVPGFENDAFAALAQNVRKSEVHEFIVSGISDEQLQRFIVAFDGWSADVVTRESCLVDLEAVRAAGGDLLPLLSGNTRAQIRRALRKYRERGEVVVEVATDVRQAREFFAELVQLHEQRWQERGHSGAFATAARRAFHVGLLERAVASQVLSLVRVRAGNFTIGVLYLLTANRYANFYQSGFHGSDDPHLKPGLVSHYLAIQHLCGEGFVEYDFLSSLPNESRYKASLATGSRPLHWLTLSRPALRNTLLHVVRKFR